MCVRVRVHACVCACTNTCNNANSSVNITRCLSHGCLYIVLQILVDTAQKRQALNEVEARHMEIIQLEANIRVSLTFL